MPPAAANACRPGTPLPYPASKKVDQVDTYHGVQVADPYRWLEDGNSADTAAWIAAQNKLTQSYLAQIPQRETIRARLTELWNYERFSVPVKEGGRYFYSRNDGLQNQSVLYVAERLDAEPRVLLDPNTLSKDGTVALNGTKVSPDGRYLAYGISASGSDWVEWKVRDIASGQDLPDHLKWTKFTGAAWLPDGSGFFYSGYAAPDEKQKLAASNVHQKLYFHKLGTPQSEDVVVYERADQPKWLFGAKVTDDGAYLLISISGGSAGKNRLYYKDLSKPGNPVVPLFDAYDASYSVVDNIGPVFLVRTDKDAPTHRLVAVDVRKPAEWRDLIPAQKETLQGVSTVGGKLVATYMKDARSQVKIFGLDGSLERELALPGLGTVSGFGGKRGERETFYAFTSYTTPTRIYRLDTASGESTLYRAPKVAFNPDDYETRQVFYTSKDGTRVPMFITAKKGLPQDGNNPTYLYGYGGFNVSQQPAFSPSSLAFMEMGGVVAVANLRGGGEYGREWHLAGTKLKKQNVFDDFIAAGEWLVANKMTRPAKLAIAGGSNGGLLVGAAMIQRPDLFGAALPAVGVMDMLRFHKFTIGWAWVGDYGSSDNADEFKALLAYSPLHTLKAGTCYPATMITTADHDDRVVPAHSFKFAAAAQAAHQGAAPMLIRISTKAGHGAGKPTSMAIEEAADRWAFLVKELDITVPAKK